MNEKVDDDDDDDGWCLLGLFDLSGPSSLGLGLSTARLSSVVLSTEVQLRLHGLFLQSEAADRSSKALAGFVPLLSPSEERWGAD